MGDEASSNNFVDVEKVELAAEQATLGYCPTCDALNWVSKEYTPPFEAIVLGRFAARTCGFEISRKAANHLAQSPNSDTWGPDLLWDTTTKAARLAIQQGASEEEIGKVVARATWKYVLNISKEISKTVRAALAPKYLAHEFDAVHVLKVLKQSMDTDNFKKGLPEAQNFYKTSVSNLEQKMKAEHLIE